MTTKKTKICLNTMVANEAHCIIRMLESCYQYIDYWVIQDNGSKDGTQDLIRNFFKEKNIPGLLYETEWRFPGYNRDHTLQTCLKENHGCDWILRIDADERLEVDPDFDWSILDNASIQSFQVPAVQNQHLYNRCWLWNAKLPWRFKHDKRHETIYLDQGDIGEGFQRVNLPKSFRHIVIGDGQTWFNTTKFFADALELEKDLLSEKKMTTDLYHLFYLAKSYRDSAMDPRNTFPFGEEQLHECCRRAFFYFKKLMDLTHDFSKANQPKYMDETAYMTLIYMGECCERMGQDTEAMFYYTKAGEFCPPRNEHAVKLAELYSKWGDRRGFLTQTSKMMAEKKPNPFPQFCFFLDNAAYVGSSDHIRNLHKLACMMNNILQAS